MLVLLQGGSGPLTAERLCLAERLQLAAWHSQIPDRQEPSDCPQGDSPALFGSFLQSLWSMCNFDVQSMCNFDVQPGAAAMLAQRRLYDS